MANNQNEGFINTLKIIAENLAMAYSSLSQHLYSEGGNKDYIYDGRDAKLYGKLSSYFSWFRNLESGSMGESRGEEETEHKGEAAENPHGLRSSARLVISSAIMSAYLMKFFKSTCNGSSAPNGENKYVELFRELERFVFDGVGDPEEIARKYDLSGYDEARFVDSASLTATTELILSWIDAGRNVPDVGDVVSLIMSGYGSMPLFFMIYAILSRYCSVAQINPVFVEYSKRSDLHDKMKVLGMVGGTPIIVEDDSRFIVGESGIHEVYEYVKAHAADRAIYISVGNIAFSRARGHLMVPGNVIQWRD